MAPSVEASVYYQAEELPALPEPSTTNTKSSSSKHVPIKNIPMNKDQTSSSALPPRTHGRTASSVQRRQIQDSLLIYKLKQKHKHNECTKPAAKVAEDYSDIEDLSNLPKSPPDVIESESSNDGKDWDFVHSSSGESGSERDYHSDDPELERVERRKVLPAYVANDMTDLMWGRKEKPVVKRPVKMSFTELEDVDRVEKDEEFYRRKKTRDSKRESWVRRYSAGMLP